MEVHYGTMDLALTDICLAGRNVRVQYKLDVPETGVKSWSPEFDVSRAGYHDGDDFYVVAGWDRNPCPDVSTGS